MNNILAIFIKQLTSHIKVPVLIVQGLMFVGFAIAFMVLLPQDEDRDCSQ
ncbi:MAG: hypothetical protein FWB96_07220 [Defluviitaleaceae bacterium]|nr:hypothetical protein [Defluviitaleaceae bacterium]MCL2262465.1 hypothetical protein [Defluviitaleaceae bacterium]